MATQSSKDRKAELLTTEKNDIQSLNKTKELDLKIEDSIIKNFLDQKTKEIQLKSQETSQDLNQQDRKDIEINQEQKDTEHQKFLLEAIKKFLILPFDNNNSFQQKDIDDQSKEAADRLAQQFNEIYISKFMDIDRRIEYLKHNLSGSLYGLLIDDLKRQEERKHDEEEASYQEYIEEYEKEQQQKEQAHHLEDHSHNHNDLDPFEGINNQIFDSFNHEKDDHIDFLDKMSNDDKQIKPLFLLINKFKEAIKHKDNQDISNLKSSVTNDSKANNFIQALCDKYNNSTDAEKKELTDRINAIEAKLHKELVMSRIREKDIEQKNINQNNEKIKIIDDKHLDDVKNTLSQYKITTTTEKNQKKIISQGDKNYQGFTRS